MDAVKVLGSLLGMPTIAYHFAPMSGTYKTIEAQCGPTGAEGP